MDQKVVDKNIYSECINPATGEAIGRSYLHSREEVALMFEKARAVQDEWADLPLKEKIVLIKKVQAHILERIDEISGIIAKSTGKTRIDALAAEVFPAIAALDYYCKKASSFLKDKKIKPSSMIFINKRSKIIREPYGLVAIISPWNYPFSIPFSELIMALLAGNCVVLKVATETQMVGLALKECVEAAGLPEGVFSYVNMGGSESSETFFSLGVDKLFFTGSVNVGKLLSEQAAKSLTPVCLELGGNDAMLVCEDADLHKAASGAIWAGFQNAGQSCGGVERIYVHQAVYDDFLDVLGKKTRALRVGQDKDHDVDISCLTTSRQVGTVRRHIDDALASGAKVYAQAHFTSPLDNPHFILPLVLTEVNHSMLVMREESFGPVLAVMKVKDMDEAIVYANDSSLGLTASVWSRDRKKAEALLRKIKVGAATVNDHLMSHGLPETPWGGPKESGGGRTHGAIGFDEMTYPRLIVHDLMPGFIRKNPWWHPFSPSVYQALKGISYAFYGSGIKKRAKGILSFLKILPSMFKA